MRFFGKIFCLILLVKFAVSQEIPAQQCGFNVAREKARQWFLNYDVNEKHIGHFPSNNSKISVTSLTIPVVFHVLHLDGTENISDTQIQDAVSILNKDFRKLNADTTDIVPSFKNLAADCNIEFVLASKDPDGKCTNGITRHFTTKSDWKIEMDYYEYTWPPSQYLNIYVVRNMPPGIAAYTYLPGTVSFYMDAVVTGHQYVGSIGTSNPGVSRVLTHEVGHWLGLAHTWGSSNSVGVACGDDGVTDTPITKGFSWCNLGNAAVCNPAITENVQNYMDYSYCSRMFTIGQAAKMNAILASNISGRNNLHSSSNLLATGVLMPNYNCPPKPDFSTLSNITCVNKAHSFIDRSYNAQPSAWLWSSPMAISNSTLQNGVLTFSASGLIPVKLKTSNNFGVDSVTKNNFITVLSIQPQNVNQVQDFESISLPDNRWIVSIPKYGSGFVLRNNAGKNSSHSLYINNYTDNPSEPVSLFTPPFNLSSVTNAKLVFDYAYALKGNNNNDMFRIYASDDCGDTWLPVYNSSGSALSTTSLMPSVAFNNPASTEWKNELVDISTLQGKQQVYFKFEFTPDPTGSGNNFYLDDIRITGLVSLTEWSHVDHVVQIFPNPASERVNITSDSPVRCVELYNSLGKMLKQDKELFFTEYTLHTSNYQSGIYFISLLFSDGAKKVYKICLE